MKKEKVGIAPTFLIFVRSFYSKIIIHTPKHGMLSCCKNPCMPFGGIPTAKAVEGTFYSQLNTNALPFIRKALFTARQKAIFKIP